MKIQYDASANFDIEDIELEVPDNASSEDILCEIVNDLEDRYRLRIFWTAKKGENE